jgi:DNA-directed RNA polymerase specialized sigma54-like protein
MHTRTKVDSKTKKFKLQNIMQKQEQTAVEEFAIALYEGGYLQGNGDEIQKLLEHYLEMEKEKIMKAHISAGARLEDISIEAAEEYYEQTYGGNK